MATLFRTILCLTVIVGFVPSNTILAQTATASSTPTNIDNTWYRLEKIEGDIDVGDFVVGPGRTEITVSPGETVIQEITVTNRISDGRTYSLEIDDITGSADGSSSGTLSEGARGPYRIRD